jgi:hypothetical protein
MNAKKVILILFVITWLVLAPATLIPRATAHHVSYLGYKAVCSFAPFSTLICLALAAFFYLLLRYV